jgi:hypothetical protein
MGCGAQPINCLDGDLGMLCGKSDVISREPVLDTSEI